MKKRLIFGASTLCAMLGGYGHPLDWTFIPFLVTAAFGGIGAAALARDFS
jgi:hypothetical protein